MKWSGISILIANEDAISYLTIELLLGSIYIFHCFLEQFLIQLTYAKGMHQILLYIYFVLHILKNVQQIIFMMLLRKIIIFLQTSLSSASKYQY